MGLPRTLPTSLFLLIACLVCLSTCPEVGALHRPYEGFGATTEGGAGGSIVHVTTLNDSGPGSLREALMQGNRTIVFDVGGEITLSNYLYVEGAFITIDGFSAPSPGITLRNRGLIIRGNRGAHDVIVQGLRIRNSPIDGLQVAYGAYNVVIDHVSIGGSKDGNIDVTFDAHDVTVSWSIFAGNTKNMLIKYDPKRITLHHNIMVGNNSRNPQVRINNGTTAVATGTTADIRNNLVWGWSGYGTLVWHGPRVNVVNNFYSHADDAISVVAAQAYVQGNASANGMNINQVGNVSSPFSAPGVATQDACTAAHRALKEAGVRPLDNFDRLFLSRITLPACETVPPVLAVTPGNLAFDATVDTLAPAAQVLAIGNAGGETLGWTAKVTTSSGGAWLSADPVAGTAPAALTVTANPIGLVEGLYEGTVTLTATATNSPQSIPVILVVDPSPFSEKVLLLPITAAANDAREKSGGSVFAGEGRLLVGKNNLVALRFTNVSIPPGAIIESAVLRLYGKGRVKKNIAIRYLGEAIGDSAPFSQAPADLSSRMTTAVSVNDTPDPWLKNDFNASPDLRAIVQRIVDRSDWRTGSSLTLFIADHGSKRTRSVGSFESGPAASEAPILSIVYTTP